MNRSTPPVLSTDDFLRQTNQVRQGLLDLMDQTTSTSLECQLPDPKGRWDPFYHKLRENQFQLLVLGEIKRGKSSFINALIGRQLLPVDVDVATCQVFRIVSGPELRCRVVYEDDSTRDIAPEELAQYGSQSLQDQIKKSGGQLQPKGDLIRWIEVQVPVRFLPSNIALLDTPGLGGMYAHHAQITYRYLPRTDGVIFVLDAEKPIMEKELEVLGSVLEHTRHIFFVLTKIDTRDKAEWTQIQQRNIELIQQRFGQQLGQIKLWPISSTNLFQGLELEVDEVIRTSGYSALTPALSWFVYQAAGWSHSAATWPVVGSVLAEGRTTLIQRQQHLKKKSAEQLSHLTEEIRSLKRGFEAKWGVNGSKRCETLQFFNTQEQACRDELAKLFTCGGDIYEELVGKCESLDSLKKLKEFGNTLKQEGYLENLVLSKLNAKYQQYIDTLDKRLEYDLQQLQRDSQPWQVDVLTTKQLEKNIEGLKSDIVRNVMAFSRGMMFGLPLKILFTTGLGPFAILLVIALWGGMKTLNDQIKQELAKSKAQLSHELKKLLAQVQNELFSKKLDCDGKSQLDTALEQIRTRFEKVFADTIREKEQPINTEIEYLQQQQKATAQEREKETRQIDSCLTAWSRLQKHHHELGGQLKTLEAAIRHQA